jgi:glyoxylase-like metal-dependent hydrolase (beta-lactamase superfamily II)
MTSISSGKGYEVTSDIYYYTNQIVNLVMVGNAAGNRWVLVDAGMPKSGSEIIDVAKSRFGSNSKPAAIILTHGHFDHVGGLVTLLKEWQVPVYAHPLEFPYLTGEQSYPEPDPSVEGGMLAKIASIYPNEPININGALQPLPQDGTVPFMSGWQWIHTPGHSAGHTAFFRQQDRVLLSADAVITVKQDSFYKVLIQKKELNGPPRYFTTDWQAAWQSVIKLEALKPNLLIPGHGPAMEGEELRTGLKKLAEEFDQLAIPDYGKYVKDKNQPSSR